jgi:hypothetical protein
MIVTNIDRDDPISEHVMGRLVITITVSTRAGGIGICKLKHEIHTGSRETVNHRLHHELKEREECADRYYGEDRPVAKGIPQVVHVTAYLRVKVGHLFA